LDPVLMRTAMAPSVAGNPPGSNKSSIERPCECVPPRPPGNPGCADEYFEQVFDLSVKCDYRRT
jgi:hypothetical protein